MWPVLASRKRYHHSSSDAEQMCFLTAQPAESPEDEADDFGLIEIDDPDYMRVSVRGVEYSVCITGLAKHPGTRLYNMGQLWKLKASAGCKRKVFYLNRNPMLFHCILDYHTSGELHLPDGLCPSKLKGELAFWGIGPETIAPCCLWKSRDG